MKKTKSSLSTKDQILKIKEENPSWGYRKVCNYINKNKKNKTNQSAVYLIMKENSLLLPQNKKLIKQINKDEDHFFKISIIFHDCKK